MKFSTWHPPPVLQKSFLKRMRGKGKWHRWKKITLWYIFLSKIFGVSYSSGEASKSWMYEWRSKAITIRAVVVRTGSLCPVSESQCSSECVCVHFKRAINMAKRLASKNSLQVLSYSAAPDPSYKKMSIHFSVDYSGGKIVLVKHYWHTLTHISSIQCEESQFSFGDSGDAFPRGLSTRQDYGSQRLGL